MKQQQQRTETIQEQREIRAAALSMQQEEQPFSLTKAQIIAMGGTLAASGILDAALHFNPEWVAAGILATAIAGKATPLFQMAMSIFVPTDPDAVEDVASRFVDAVAPLEETDLPQDTVSKLKRLFHVGQEQYIEAPAQPKDGREEVDPVHANNKRKLVAKQSEPQASDDDLISYVPPAFTADEVLDVIQAFNAQDCIYFGDSKDGAVALSFDDMYHVFDMSASGKGKSNRMRLAMMQIAKYCQAYYINPLAAPVKKVRDKRQVEVWQPIYDLLAGKHKAPVQEGDAIGQLLGTLVNEIDRRNKRERRRDFAWEERPIFVFIDELPEVFKRCPEAKEHMDTIGRMGRQYRIFMWVCSQNARVATTGLSLDALANFHTRIYGGGDARSRENIIGPVSRDMDRTLASGGAGLTLMLADGMDASDFVRAPLLTNEAMFDYLELPPFDLEDWLLPDEDEELSQENRALDLSSFIVSSQKNDANGLPSLPNDPPSRKETMKDERDERVEYPNAEVILDALNALEEEGKTLTLNAIAKRANLTWNFYKEIEAVAVIAGFNIVQGKGRARA